MAVDTNLFKGNSSTENNHKLKRSRESTNEENDSFNPKLKISVRPTFHKKIEEINTQLLKLEHDMKQVMIKIDASGAPELQALSQLIAKKYDELQDEKSKCAQQTTGSYIKLMARDAFLPSGLQIYHCSGSSIAIKSILENGIITQGLEHNFLNPDLGNGLYCSAEIPAYLCDEFPVALVLKVIKDTPCVITKSLHDYLEEKKIDPLEVYKDYQLLTEDTCALVNQSLHAAMSEILLIEPLRHIGIVGLILNPNIDIEHVQNSDITPIEQWMEEKQICLHPSWVVSPRTD